MEEEEEVVVVVVVVVLLHLWWWLLLLLAALGPLLSQRGGYVGPAGAYIAPSGAYVVPAGSSGYVGVSGEHLETKSPKSTHGGKTWLSPGGLGAVSARLAHFGCHVGPQSGLCWPLLGYLWALWGPS